MKTKLVVFHGFTTRNTFVEKILKTESGFFALFPSCLAERSLGKLLKVLIEFVNKRVRFRLFHFDS